MTLASDAVTIEQDDTALVTGAIVRGGSFAGDVVIGVTGLPTGVTATGTTVASAFNGIVIRLSVAPSTADGVYNLTVRASGNGVASDSGYVALTVAPALASSIGVTLASGTLAIASLTQAAAIVRDARGLTIVRDVTWGSSNPGVASISATGVITALATGTTTISANSGGVTGSAELVVSPAAVGSVSVALSTSTIVAGAKGLATATVKDNGGAVLFGRAITWASSSQAVATIDAAGALTAVAAGTTTISGTSSGMSGSAQLIVSAPGPNSVTVTLASPTVTAGALTSATGVVRDINGAIVFGGPITWSSSSASVATITSLGIVTAIAPGTATITAASGALTGNAVLTVTQSPVSTVLVTLGTGSVSPGGSTQATATLHDAFGATLTGRAITWGSSNQSVATVSATGGIATSSIGVVTITATSEGKNGVAFLTVSQPTPPGATAICKDGTYSYSATHSGTCSYHGGVAIWL